MLNETQISDIWLNFVEYLDKKQLENVAERYVDLLADFGVPDKIFKEAIGVDETLDQAIEYYLNDDLDTEEDDVQELDF
jgi:ADP-heptose:LPS heptosyltransferase